MSEQPGSALKCMVMLVGWQVNIGKDRKSYSHTDVSFSSLFVSVCVYL